MSMRQFSSSLLKIGKQANCPFKNSSPGFLPVYISTRLDSFKAAVLKKPNEELEIKEVKEKKLKKGQVRIKVQACAVNASDYLLTQGFNPSGFPLPITPGYELSGVVLECKECEDVAKGDKVIALNKDDLGGFAEQCVVNEKDIWLMPSGLSFPEAAAVADSFGTSLLGLSRHGHLLEKQTVVVTMAPAHGCAPLDLAANVYKAKVIAVTTNEEDTERMRERGAWAALAYDSKRLQSVVKEVTGGKGADVIYDTLAGEVLDTSLKCVAHEGHILVAGYTLKELPVVQISQLLSLPSFYISGVSLRSYRKHAFQTYRQTISDVLEMYERKLIKPELAQTFPLKEVNKAIETIKEKKPIGKVVIEVAEPK